MKPPGTLAVALGLLLSSCSGDNAAGGRGVGGASGGSVGGASGGSVGGASAGAGGASVASCPAAEPRLGDSCAFSGPGSSCNYRETCTCSGCCYSGYGCSNGAIVYLGYNDGCLQGGGTGAAGACGADAGDDAEGDAGIDAEGDAGIDAEGGAGGDAASDAAVRACTPGADQTCNDNPAISSLHGHCTDAGTCVCGNDAAPSPSSGRCP